MTKDMTNGNSIRLILAFSIPMLFGNLFQQFYNMVDSIVVGRFVSKDALGAVGATGAINFLIIGFLMGICSGFTIKVAQTFGAGDFKAMRSYIANGAYLCGIFTVLLTTLTMIFTRPLLVLMKTPKSLIEDAYSYIIIIFAGIAVIMAYNYLSCISRALGDSKTPLYFLIVASLINVVLDLVFVLSFGLGVKGVGYATVIAQAISAFFCFIYMKKKYTILQFTKEELALDFDKWKSLCQVGIPMALQFSITAIGAIILQVAVNSLGPDSVAAVTSGNRLQMIFTQPMETLGITMATFCGQNLGAGKMHRVKEGITKAMKVSVIYCIVSGILICLCANLLSLIFVKASETVVIAETAHYLRVNAVCYTALGILFVLRNSLQGLGYSFLPMMAGVLELIARTFVSICLLGVLKYTAVCVAGPVAWILADVLLVTVYIIKVVKKPSLVSTPKTV